MKNAEYWKNRFIQLEERLNRTSSEASAEIEKQYRQAQREIEEKILLWYKRLADNNGITFAQAKKFLKTSELEEFKWDVQDYIKYGRENSLNQKWIKELENASAKYHISYYETLKIETRQSFEKLFQKVFEATRDSMKKVYEDSYFRTAYEVQKGLNLGWSLQGLDQNKIEKAILKPWAADGKVFSDRIWSDKDKLISELNSELTRMAVTGDSPDRAAENIAKKLKTSKNNAWRIVQTESSAMHAASQQDCYKDLGVEEFEVSETLDKHTCEICGEMDGQHFPLSEYIIGLTAPPFHPRCRGCTCPYFEDDLGERIARDAKTGEVYYLPSNTTYKQWKEMQAEKYGSGAVDTARKMTYNKSADKKQYERYKALMDDDFPDTFEDFQKLKYDTPELWGSYKALARSKNYLQQKLNYVWNGEKCFIPMYTKFDKVVTIAGKNSDTAIRCVDRLVETYGGKSDEWQKRAGKVTSAKYIFDLHWYESDGIQYEVKLKNRKESKQNEN